MDFAAHAHVAATAAHATAQEAASHRNYLYRFAMQKVGDADLSDDLVQETLLAALQAAQKNSANNFEGRSTYRVWLVGILKHKIMDAWRERGRTVNMASEEDEADDSLLESAINQAADPATRQQNDPHAQYAWQQLASRVQRAADTLPTGTAEVFVAREIEGESTESLCARLGLTEQNVWIRVHRARKALKQALTADGFVAAMA